MNPQFQTIINEHLVTFGMLGLYNPARTAEVSKQYATAIYKKLKKIVGKEVCVTVVSRIIDGVVKIATSIG